MPLMTKVWPGPGGWAAGGVAGRVMKDLLCLGRPGI